MASKGDRQQAKRGRGLEKLLRGSVEAGQSEAGDAVEAVEAMVKARLEASAGQL